MRGIILVTIFWAGVAHAAWNGYEETRDLRLDGAALSRLDIDAGAGSLTVTGDAAASDIVVVATIRVPGRNDDKAKTRIDEDMQLTLTTNGDRARLESHFESGAWNWGDQPTIDLEVRLPARLELTIDDGSGSLRVAGVDGDIHIDDGSGSLSLSDAGGRVTIDDGSGSVSVEDVSGELRIIDGSGSIRVNDTADSVYIEDGSGSITVQDVAGDFIVDSDGSGGLRFKRIQGRVEVPD